LRIEVPRVRNLQCGKFVLPLERPLVMGIVNVTPDSFSDGGQFFSAQAAIDHAQQLIEEGADILDIGGESTRPGAAEVDAGEELRRVLPVVEALRDCGIALSIDTIKPEVMRAAIQAGASMVNDVNALRAPAAIEACAASDVAVCLMHRLGTPRTMQQDPQYGDVLNEVKTFLLERARACEQAGIARERIVIDPGFGFGKTSQHNLDLIRGLPELAAIGYAVLAGISRKSVLGRLVGRDVGSRLSASVAAALLLAQRRAAILRVHDVQATVDALKVWQAVESG
jgi:dihydropteroate synthase